MGAKLSGHIRRSDTGPDGVEVGPGRGARAATVVLVVERELGYEVFGMRLGAKLCSRSTVLRR